jgi:hypothetical protein
MVSICDPKAVPGIFDDHMLKSPTGAKTWNALGAAESNQIKG